MYPTELYEEILRKIDDDIPYVSLRLTNRDFKKIVDCILREKYESELCELLRHMTISRMDTFGKYRMKDIISKAYSYSTTIMETTCKRCGSVHYNGILGCECMINLVNNPLQRIFTGPVLVSVVAISFITLKWFKKT